MTVTAKIAALTAVTALVTAGAARAVPTVSNVSMEQIAGTRWVEITYDLGDEDAIVTLSIETNGVAIPDSSVTWLSGDVCKKVVSGTGKSILWNAGADWPENVVDTAKARVTAWCTNTPPLYCSVNLVGGTDAAAYPVHYYTSAEAIPEGVTNEMYKTYFILMRRIDPASCAGFIMGSPTNEMYRTHSREAPVQAILTKGYYAGVYQVTQSQWQQVMGDILPWPAYFTNIDYRRTRPVEQVSYFDIRENPEELGSEISPNWPQTNAVHASSFMGRLRLKTGLTGFDLPTDAQCEYACRAGTTGALNDGTVNITNSYADARLDLLGRYHYSGGMVWDGSAWKGPGRDCSTENGTAAVGSYLSNAWGLYDTHGNVHEWCLDWMEDALLGGIDPVGPTTGSNRVRQGGSWNSGAPSCRTAFRTSSTPSERNPAVGFRLVRTLP